MVPSTADESAGALLELRHLTTCELLDRVREATGLGVAEGTMPFELLLHEEAEPPQVAIKLLLHEEAEPPQVAINQREDTAVLLYSDGTTGLPKGTMLTHRER